jgi:hypothetical protein
LRRLDGGATVWRKRNVIWCLNFSGRRKGDSVGFCEGEEGEEGVETTEVAVEGRQLEEGEQVKGEKEKRVRVWVVC